MASRLEALTLTTFVPLAFGLADLITTAALGLCATVGCIVVDPLPQKPPPKPENPQVDPKQDDKQDLSVKLWIINELEFEAGQQR